MHAQQFFQIFGQIIAVLFFILLGLIVGGLIERSHLRKLKQKEKELSDILTCNLKKLPYRSSCEPILVAGSVCIATDYFKNFLAGLRNFFGGEMRAYETLMDRARREAMLRMKLQAKSMNAKSIWNVRFETATIQGKKKSGGIEVIAYGTAIIEK